MSTRQAEEEIPTNVVMVNETIVDDFKVSCLMPMCCSLSSIRNRQCSVHRGSATYVQADEKAHTVMVERELMAPVECDGDGVCLKCVCTVDGEVEHCQVHSVVIG